MINANIPDSFTLDTRVLVLQTSRLPLVGKHVDEYVFYDQNRRRTIADRDVNGNNAI